MCIAPVILKNSTYPGRNGLMVPCGKCHECYNKRSANWSFRLLQEERNSSSSTFVTLTYRDEELWLTDDNKASLEKRDLQLFFKRLRKKTKSKIKYYACGEYGERTLRPHYHAIIFNANTDDILDAWGLGNCHFEKVTPASIRYVTNYLMKGKGLNPKGTNPEFSLMSQGLGKKYLTMAKVKWHQNNDANYIVLPGGAKQSLPRYYKDKIFDHDQRRYFALEMQIKEKEKAKKQIQKDGVKKWHHNVVESKKQSVKSAEYKKTLRNKI